MRSNTKSSTPNVAEMEATRIARFDELVVRDRMFAAAVLRDDSAKAGLVSRKILGSGIVDPAIRQPKIVDEHPFAMTLTDIPSGHSASLHAHSTEEIFLVLEGELTFIWGEKGEYESVLGKYDTISMPKHIFRAFENRTDSTVRMLIVLGGTYEQTKNSVTYQPELIARAKASGVVLDGAVAATSN